MELHTKKKLWVYTSKKLGAKIVASIDDDNIPKKNKNLYLKKDYC